MQPAMAIVAEAEAARKVQYFSATGCVVSNGEMREAFVGGTLVGSWRNGETSTRNLLLISLGGNRGLYLGRLAKAFGLSEERLRQLRRRSERGGIAAVLGDRMGGPERKRTPALEAKLVEMFEQGRTIEEAHRRVKRQASRTVVGRVHRDYVLGRLKDGALQRDGTAMQANTSTPNTEARQLEMIVESTSAPADEIAESTSAPADEIAESTLAPADEIADVNNGGSKAGEVIQQAEGVRAAGKQERAAANQGLAQCREHDTATTSLEEAADRGGRMVQHLGVWVMLGLLNALGLYRLAENLRRVAEVEQAKNEQRFISDQALRVVLDAVIAALCLEQRCVEGVRRIATPSSATLLRSKVGVTAAWARNVLGRFAAQRGSLFHVAMTKLLLLRARDGEEAPAVFYVDNHMRPYTGKRTLRKGWRMQDKRARPGTSDYYVHDEDGRPLVRVERPDHASMLQVLRPIGRMLRALLGEAKSRVMLIFDRAGAYASELEALRDEGFDFATYELGPYTKLPATAFECELKLGKDRIRYTERAAKNLRKGRGRVRRISLRMSDDEQINIVCISALPADEVIPLMLARWARQENQFKYEVERWGINHLDGRAVEAYPPDTIIPNPARRRLDRALKIARHEEAEALRKIEHLPANDPKRERLRADASRARQQQEELLAQRPSVPKKAPLRDTELADKLVHHRGDYKFVMDTLRIALANMEAELAARLGCHLSRPAEAKKTLANLLAAPGRVRLSRDRISVTLIPAGTRRERRAFAAILDELNRLNLNLPGDRSQRPLRFRTQSQ